MVETETKILRYESYKDSGVEWLGDIPEHWEIKKLKFLGKIFAGINGKKGDDFSKEFKEGFKPFIPFTNICNNLKISDEQYQYVNIDSSENQNLVEFNDILFLMSSETLEDIAKCSIYLGQNNELYLNSFCKGFRVIEKSVYPEYLNYLLSSNSYRSYFALKGRGFTRINLKQEYINDALVTIPPLPEQTAIAQFLDDKTTKIDEAIAIKQQQIALLKERKLVLIENAVTRGVNPNVNYKKSGVRWLDNIPEHWQVVRSKRLFVARKERAQKGDLQLTASQKFGVIPQKKYMELEGRKITQVEFNYEILKRIRKGDFVISMRSFQGGIEYCDYDGCVSSAYVPLIPIKHIETSYYKYLFKSRKYIKELSSTSNLVRDGQALRFDNFSQVDLLIIPLQEQRKIAEFLDKQCEKMETAISLKEQEISKLQEYKSSLINSVVTGKVRVF
ncbi:MAG: hypothetical protein Tsb0033_18910 [Winogradskyella sp.]